MLKFVSYYILIFIVIHTKPKKEKKNYKFHMLCNACGLFEICIFLTRFYGCLGCDVIAGKLNTSENSAGSAGKPCLI